MKLNRRSGFTLIEMLIVIAIIGILATIILVGLGPVQRHARDVRRLSDLREVQTALELYYNKCGHYPGDASCASTPPSDWGDLSNDLTQDGEGITEIPTDPNSNTPYVYGTDQNQDSYVLQATLEEPVSSVSNNPSVDPSKVGSGVSGVACDATENEYCVSL